MFEIFNNLCGDYDYRLSDESKQFLKDHFYKLDKNKTFGNGRYVRNLMNMIPKTQAVRLLNQFGKNIQKEEKMNIECIDIERAILKISECNLKINSENKCDDNSSLNQRSDEKLLKILENQELQLKNQELQLKNQEIQLKNQELFNQTLMQNQALILQNQQNLAETLKKVEQSQQNISHALQQVGQGLGMIMQAFMEMQKK